jgi:hypothetical protein
MKYGKENKEDAGVLLSRKRRDRFPGERGRGNYVES